ncbi:MAG TPA: DNA cytosine methyltransferase [Candidatus Omnitrophota bacterium]|nr:DNA cytosine methyltransferase [Candidatus Omnitrophota bacterium]
MGEGLIEPTIDDESYFRSGSGLYLPANYYPAGVPRERPLCMDLFSGCGGFSLGMVRAGFDVIAALEWDPPAIHTYLVNLGAYPVQMVFITPEDRERTEKYLEKEFKRIMKARPDFSDQGEGFRCGRLMSGSNRHRAALDWEGCRYMFVGDIRKITGQEILDVMGLQSGDLDCVCGGPPCQGFSTSGRQNVMDPRNSLVFEFAKLIVEMQPKTMIFENVPGILDMVTPEGIPVMDAVCKILEDGNYGNYDALRKSLLASAGCGAALKGSKGTRKGEKERWTPKEKESAIQGGLF